MSQETHIPKARLTIMQISIIRIILPIKLTGTIMQTNAIRIITVPAVNKKTNHNKQQDKHNIVVLLFYYNFIF